MAELGMINIRYQQIMFRISRCQLPKDVMLNLMFVEQNENEQNVSIYNEVYQPSIHLYDRDLDSAVSN